MKQQMLEQRSANAVACLKQAMRMLDAGHLTLARDHLDRGIELLIGEGAE